MNPARRFVIPRFFTPALVAALTLGATSILQAAALLVTSTNDTGSGSLRQAILDANSTSEPDVIAFQIPGGGPFTISPVSKLPPITAPVRIDGTTQPGYAGTPLIELNGASMPAESDGLLITGGASVIRGLAINHCKRDGIRIQGPGGNSIEGNYLGTDPSGTIARPNGESGVFLFRSGTNVIGGGSLAARNVISGGNLNGIFVLDPPSRKNVIEGNFIGVSATGTGALGNQQNGIAIASAPECRISNNVISGNGESGVYLLGAAATNNVIEANLIGTDFTGKVAIGNRLDGVTIYGAAGNTIGGTAMEERNVISGNVNVGVRITLGSARRNVVMGNYIGTDATGLMSLANRTNGVTVAGAPGNTVGGTIAGARNLISGNEQNGILIIEAGSSNNLVQGNFIGVDATGSSALPNTTSGVTIDRAAGNRVGGTTEGARNVISGNKQVGIYLVEAGGGNNVVQGNFVGSDGTGTSAVPNSLAGIRIETPGNIIGGVEPGARNVISGNRQSGIFLFGTNATNNLVEGNFIGTDASGNRALGNAFGGVSFFNASDNQIGGADANARNLISANSDSGISLQGQGTTRNVVQGNFIGTDLGGTTALGNAVGGIYLYGASSNSIGGTLPGTGNLISGNSKTGISIGDPGANGNLIQGNFIGTAYDGLKPLPNQWHNIELLNTASGNLIGGPTAQSDNLIGYTGTAGYDGIRIRDGCIGNLISRNSIFSNGESSPNGLGIDLSADGVSADQRMLLEEAVSDENVTIIRGQLKGVANQRLRVQFYANQSAHVSGYGEGQIYLGVTSIDVGAGGQRNFTATFPTGKHAGEFISATLTDSEDNTSEFARDIQALEPPALIARAATIQAGRMLEWPDKPGGFVLLNTTNLTSPVSWVLATGLVVKDGGTNRVLLVPEQGNLFYRLEFVGEGEQ